MDLAPRHSSDMIRSTVVAAEDSAASAATVAASILGKIVVTTAGSQKGQCGETEKCLSHDVFL
jgi:hypothetical protein